MNVASEWLEFATWWKRRTKCFLQVTICEYVNEGNAWIAGRAETARINSSASRCLWPLHRCPRSREVKFNAHGRNKPSNVWQPFRLCHRSIPFPSTFLSSSRSLSVSILPRRSLTPGGFQPFAMRIFCTVRREILWNHYEELRNWRKLILVSLITGMLGWSWINWGEASRLPLLPVVVPSCF